MPRPVSCLLADLPRDLAPSPRNAKAVRCGHDRDISDHPVVNVTAERDKAFLVENTGAAGLRIKW